MELEVMLLLVIIILFSFCESILKSVILSLGGNLFFLHCILEEVFLQSVFVNSKPREQKKSSGTSSAFPHCLHRTESSR